MFFQINPNVPPLQPKPAIDNVMVTHWKGGPPMQGASEAAVRQEALLRPHLTWMGTHQVQPNEASSTGQVQLR